MSEKNENSSKVKTGSDLENLEQRINAATKKHSPEELVKDDNSMLGLAWRISTELVVAVLIGTLIGYGIDYFAGTRPIVTIIGLALGTAAGIRNTFRLVLTMEAAEKERLEKLNQG